MEVHLRQCSVWREDVILELLEARTSYARTADTVATLRQVALVGTKLSERLRDDLAAGFPSFTCTDSRHPPISQ